MLKIAEIPAQVTRGMYILYTFSLKIGLTNNQMGGVVIQSGKPLVFFSRKFNSTQSKYTNTEQELLAVTETLKQFWSILLGQLFKIWTDHKNLTYLTTNFFSNRVLRQWPTIEEYGGDIHVISDKDHSRADTMSWLPYTITEKIVGGDISRTHLYGDEEEEVNVLVEEPPPPFDIQHIFKNQETYPDLVLLRAKQDSHKFMRKRQYSILNLWGYCSTMSRKNEFKIYIPHFNKKW